MIITFKSAAAGDIIMFGDVARQLMQIMGKTPSDQGIVTVEQLPAAIALLTAAIAEDKTMAKTAEEKAAEHPNDLTLPKEKKTGAQPGVRLYQRAAPLLELLTWAQKKNKPVTWGG